VIKIIPNSGISYGRRRRMINTVKNVVMIFMINTRAGERIRKSETLKVVNDNSINLVVKNEAFRTKNKIITTTTTAADSAAL